MGEDIFDALLRPEDDRAWKLAVGAAIREIRETSADAAAQARLTNGRVTALEAWRNRIVGALGFIAVTAPVATTLFVKAVQR